MWQVIQLLKNDSCFIHVTETRWSVVCWRWLRGANYHLQPHDRFL